MVTSVMLIGVLADTHVPRRARDLPPLAYQYLQGVDAILHAGDVLTADLLDRLACIAPVHAVLGNNDRSLALPERLELCWEGVRLAMVHDSGAREGRAKRLRRWFPEAQVVVFGHSHIPVNECHDGLLLFNPGSPTDRRRQPEHTMGLLRLDAGTVDARILAV
ncbi:MAG TPA: metallophosphoesterase family protein [Chloroflexota bacterium]|nr:metallophosphoesterase family protein [Chloroflexota bacterium]